MYSQKYRKRLVSFIRQYSLIHTPNKIRLPTGGRISEGLLYLQFCIMLNVPVARSLEVRSVEFLWKTEAAIHDAAFNQLLPCSPVKIRARSGRCDRWDGARGLSSCGSTTGRPGSWLRSSKKSPGCFGLLRRWTNLGDVHCMEAQVYALTYVHPKHTNRINRL